MVLDFQGNLGRNDILVPRAYVIRRLWKLGRALILPPHFTFFAAEPLAPHILSPPKAAHPAGDATPHQLPGHSFHTTFQSRSTKMSNEAGQTWTKRKRNEKSCSKSYIVVYWGPSLRLNHRAAWLARH